MSAKTNRIQNTNNVCFFNSNVFRRFSKDVVAAIIIIGAVYLVKFLQLATI